MNYRYNSNTLRKRYAYLLQEARKKRYAKRKGEATLPDWWNQIGKTFMNHNPETD